MFPSTSDGDDYAQLMCIVPAALERMRPILSAVRMFKADEFDHYNSLQAASFVYLTSNEAARDPQYVMLAERLFLLNRALNALDLFYAVALPEVFFISHGVGSVLGNVDYGNRLVFFHAVTVGRVGQDRPKIGSDVVLYPGAVVTGSTVIGARSVVAAGTVVHDVVIPEDSVVSQAGAELSIRPRKTDYVGLYLHPILSS
jgi:serine O-acetyltransferase